MISLHAKLLRRASDTYVEEIKQVIQDAGLRVEVNYGVAGFDPKDTGKHAVPKVFTSEDPTGVTVSYFPGYGEVADQIEDILVTHKFTPRRKDLGRNRVSETPFGDEVNMHYLRPDADEEALDAEEEFWNQHADEVLNNLNAKLLKKAADHDYTRQENRQRVINTLLQMGKDYGFIPRMSGPKMLWYQEEYAQDHFHEPVEISFMGFIDITVEFAPKFSEVGEDIVDYLISEGFRNVSRNGRFESDRYIGVNLTQMTLEEEEQDYEAGNVDWEPDNDQINL
jgi:hypothetical protein